MCQRVASGRNPPNAPVWMRDKPRTKKYQTIDSLLFSMLFIAHAEVQV